MSKLYLSGISDARKTGITSRGHRYINLHLRSWNAGINVIMTADECGRIECLVNRTGGSNNPCSGRLLAHIKERCYGQSKKRIKTPKASSL
jgi:hypothetical protein